MKRWTAYLLLFSGMAIFGSATPVSKLVVGAFEPMVGGLGRALIAAIALALLARRSLTEIRQLDLRGHLLLASVGLIGVVGFSVMMLYGMRLVSGVIGSVVMSTTPAVTAIAAVLFLGDRLGWRKAAAVGLTVAGVLTLQLSRTGDGASEQLWMGSALVFGAVCAEVWYTLAGKRLMDVLSPLSLAFWAAAWAVLAFIPLAAWQLPQVDWNNIGVADWGALAWWGAGTMALGSWLWYRGVNAVEGSVAAPFMGVMPVSALVLSYVLLGETFAWMHVVGFGIVLGGIALVVWDQQGENA